MTSRAREVRLGRLEVTTDRRADGTVYLTPVDALSAYPDRLTERLVQWAAVSP